MPAHPSELRRADRCGPLGRQLTWLTPSFGSRPISARQVDESIYGQLDGLATHPSTQWVPISSTRRGFLRVGSIAIVTAGSIYSAGFHVACRHRPGVCTTCHWRQQSP
ncbi:hypothetical protein BO78DRAFT_209301 [Aspergillus sclerotiicarbonarius CBS 121057]|uniref:Uncharacterized protein n=1 Tax=Aspergillus sclerotiicarbonarius (strain CBS 121057 / IBT 28362) TaxID=1448318 RepID=A0A319EQC3_ASPSB|nr:hypothetical protein BO78DRAFT_209301 [Aspergillus sclerotiicarbonarius CBS 121057]